MWLKLPVNCFFSELPAELSFLVAVMAAAAMVLSPPVSCQAVAFGGNVRVIISYNINWSAGQFRPWQVSSVGTGSYWSGWCGTWIAEGPNILVLCHGHMFTMKKTWFKKRFTMWKQKQLADLEPSGWELVNVPCR